MNGCAALHLAARLVKSQILKWLITTSLLSLFLSLSAPLSPGRCRHLFAVSRQLNAKEHLMHETDRWGKPGELPSHNNLTETAGPGPLQGKKKKSEKKKIASGLDSFLCLCDFDMLTCIRDCAVSKELKNHLRSYLGRNQAYYCEIVHNDAFCSTDMRQDKHIIHV